VGQKAKPSLPKTSPSPLIDLLDDPIPHLALPPPLILADVVTHTEQSHTRQNSSEAPTNPTSSSSGLVDLTARSPSEANSAYYTAPESTNTSPMMPATTQNRELPFPQHIQDLMMQTAEWTLKDEKDEDSPEFHLTQLEKLSLSTEAMRKHGYVVQVLDKHEIDSKKRCTVCRKQVGNQKPLNYDDEAGPRVDKNGVLMGPSLHCKFHNGILKNMVRIPITSIS
jgi:hypothetical protein